MPDSLPLVDVTVESLGGLGDGISTHAGKPLFIPKSCAGDTLRVRITRQNHDGYHGTIEEILSPGPDRVDTPCPYYHHCGGCRLQHLSEDAYRAFKTRMLHSALRQAGYADSPSQMIFLPAGARRRVEFSLDHTGPGVALAFNRLRTNTPVPITDCIVLEPGLRALMGPLTQALSALPGAEHIKYVGLTQADSGIDLLLTMHQMIDATPLEHIAGIARITLHTPDEKIHQVAQRAPVTMRLGTHDIELPPDAFLQATKAGQDALTTIALETAQGAAEVIDLFCGIGSYAFPLATQANLLAVEGDARMVSTIQRAIKAHGINTLHAQQRDLFKNPLTASELKRFGAAIINPPRVGAKAQTAQLAQSGIPAIAMISCNPATFARDARLLKDAGYRLTAATGLDQFVYSPHLEIAAVFTTKPI